MLNAGSCLLYTSICSFIDLLCFCIFNGNFTFTRITRNNILLGAYANVFCCYGCVYIICSTNIYCGTNAVSYTHLGMVLFLLIFNLGITIFVFLLTGMMIFSQILFIIFAMFLPISFLLSMIPSYENMAKQAIVRVFNTIMTRAGITLIVTVAFSISSMFYNISTDYPFFMIAFLQIVCFAGIYMKLGDLMSMFSLNAGDSQRMGRRIFRRPYMFMRHRARRMENRLVRAVGKGSMVGAGTGAMAGSVLSSAGSKQSHAGTTRKRDNASFGSRAGSAVGAVLDTKNKVKDKATAVKENIKDMPTQTAYAVHSAKEKAKANVSDFKRGIVQGQETRQSERADKLQQHLSLIHI